LPQLLNPGRNPSQFLVSLNLAKCGIPEAGGLALAAGLAAGNLRLRCLGLSNNALGNKAAAAFGELLEGSHTLKELDLGWNQIKVRPQGVEVFVR
jgi:Ran GTPase-activating protein (RanGAP) involved in mRNA processing and transport